ncbi:UTP-glucose-1-phosphate uridylyltransferase [Gymnopilus junonius]|uniref:UTP--glucose-1-phosphate uridylyltransferase n=1 Tax=Gymnopilus junonius TaxID=109634 RepID=A0A9P5NMX2_GYMJU|nr:UTP-glucose-1-phosphate uridylyltransferase [Gymnopilus junonius]
MPLFKHPIPRFRRRSAKHFSNLSNSDAGQPMTEELDKLVGTVRDSSSQKLFVEEMKSFLALYHRYRADLSNGQSLDWNKVGALTDKQVIPYDSLPPSSNTQLNKLAVLKVNGGLGTSMGMHGAKGALEVQNNFTFLDLIVQQMEHLNTTYNVDVPLLLMTSFNTEEDTLRVVKQYTNRPVKITTFNQSRYPRILKDTLLPFAKNVQDSKAAWYPPGHGDLYNSLSRSGVLDRLLSQGKEYLFISNSDNLGAVVDQRILQHMIDTQIDFVMEVTAKTKGDIKGGILINYDGSLRLLEGTQVPSEYMDEFTHSRSFRMFNTNNLWINLKALKQLLREGDTSLDIKANSKTLDDGRTVLQLETAAGSIVKHFQNVHSVHVSRERFLPVKDCSDLLLVKSDVFVLDHGRLVMNENRAFGIPPVIKLGGHFKKACLFKASSLIQQFQKRFKQIPHIVELDHLTVAGDVLFGRNVTLRGTVIIVANEGQRIDIPDGCTLENRLVSGNLNMIEL